MDNKAQGIIERTILLIPFFIILFAVFTVMDIVFNDLLFPLLGNFTYGAIVTTILSLTVLLIAVMVIMFIVKGDGGEQQRQQVVFQ